MGGVVTIAKKHAWELGPCARAFRHPHAAPGVGGTEGPGEGGGGGGGREEERKGETRFEKRVHFGSWGMVEVNPGLHGAWNGECERMRGG